MNDLASPHHLEALVSDGVPVYVEKDIFATLYLFTQFRKHMAQIPRSIQKMRNEWERAYEGIYSERLDRFDKQSQASILRNWNTIISHVDQLHSSLLNRIMQKEEEIKTFQQSVSSRDFMICTK